MKRFLAILLACAVTASAQTYITVTAETNRVIRTNFSLVRSQVSDLSGATFAISNITALQTTLDGKLATNGSAAGLSNFPASLLATNGSAAGLTNFPASLLTTNGNAVGLTNFPSSLLRTNGDGSGLTNLPNANLSNAIGVLPIANGGSGATNQAGARTAFGLGSAATNDASAFQPASSALTNLAANNGGSLTNLAYSNSVGFGTAATNDASAFQPASANLTNIAANDAAALTNFPAELLRTNGNAAALTNFPTSLLRTNGDGSGLTNVSVDLTSVLPAYSNNAGKVLAVAPGATNVEWTAISNTVTDASSLTNYPAYLLQTNGSAAGLTNFPSDLLRTNGDAANLTNFPAELLRTNGSAAGLTGFPTFNQNTTGTASNVTGVVAITNGGTAASDVTNARINLLPAYSGNAQRVLALNSNATDLVWAVDGGGQANLTNVTNTLAIANGGTGATNVLTALTNLAILGGSSSVHLAPTTTNAPSNFNVTIGATAIARNPSGVTLGYAAITADGSENGAVAIGRGAAATNGVAIGYSALNRTGRGVAIGYLATSSNNIQLGAGTNSDANTIQFRTHGTVDTNEWARIAALSTYPTTNIQVEVVGGTTNTLVFSNGILTSVTTP